MEIILFFFLILEEKLFDIFMMRIEDQTLFFQTDQQSRVSELREHPFDEQMPNDEQRIIQQCRSGKSSLNDDYLKLATAIDRVAFIVYLFLFIIFGIAYSI